MAAEECTFWREARLDSRWNNAFDCKCLLLFFIFAANSKVIVMFAIRFLRLLYCFGKFDILSFDMSHRLFSLSCLDPSFS